ncbi:hypothetical protein [Zhongshania arctica]|uniref:Uncharacterized protein n=1 Tax=Zhongshania arctica TaxID=3238302 RepID=A0ABV3TYI1_9GAMM
MDFTKVDNSFNAWASSSDIFIQREYKGEDVRSADILDINEKKWQLWLVPVNDENACVIHYWDYKKVSRHAKVAISELLSELSKIEAIIRAGELT